MQNKFTVNSNLTLVGILFYFTLMTCFPSISLASNNKYEGLFRAIDNQDYDELVSLTKNKKSTIEVVELADITLDLMLNQLEQAKIKLHRYVSRYDATSLRARAIRSLSNLYMRTGQYAKAFQEMNDLEANYKASGITIHPQTMAFTRALAKAPKPVLSNYEPSSINISYDKAGLPRVPIAVNGIGDMAIFDTGAAFTTISSSKAKDMKLTPIGNNVGIAGSTNVSVTSGLALAENLQVGGLVFRNVVVIIVPDSSLSFPQRDYYITSVLGFPQIQRMGVITISNREKASKMSINKSIRLPERDSTSLIISGLEPILLAKLGEQDVRSRLLLDTGANRSNLTKKVLDNNFRLQANAKESNRTIAGLGGEITENTKLINSLDMTIGTSTLKVGPIHIVAAEENNRRGVMGQDILSKLECVVLDFDSMKFSTDKSNCQP